MQTGGARSPLCYLYSGSRGTLSNGKGVWDPLLATALLTVPFEMEWGGRRTVGGGPSWDHNSQDHVEDGQEAVTQEPQRLLGGGVSREVRVSSLAQARPGWALRNCS